MFPVTYIFHCEERAQRAKQKIGQVLGKDSKRTSRSSTIPVRNVCCNGDVTVDVTVDATVDVTVDGTVDVTAVDSGIVDLTLVGS